MGSLGFWLVRKQLPSDAIDRDMILFKKCGKLLSARMPRHCLYQGAKRDSSACFWLTHPFGEKTRNPVQPDSCNEVKQRQTFPAMNVHIQREKVGQRPPACQTGQSPLHDIPANVPEYIKPHWVRKQIPSIFHTEIDTASSDPAPEDISSWFFIIK